MSTEKDQNTRKDLIKGIAYEAAINTSSYGIPFIVRAESIVLKIMWIVCMLILAGLAFKYTVDSLISYFDFEVTTQVQVIHEDSTLFPTVSFCNINSLITDAALNFSMIIINSLLMQAKRLNRSTPSFLANSNPDLARSIITSYAKDPQVTDSMRQSLALPLDQMILYCDFAGQPCTANDFEWYFDGYLGNCYRFNSGFNSSGNPQQLKNVSKSGKIDALNLELLMPKPKPSQFAFAKTLGAQIFIHNNTASTLPYMGFAASVGHETQIAVNRQFIERMNDPYSSCMSDIESYGSVFTKYFTTNNLYYTKQRCFEYCYQRRLVYQCGCLDTMFPVMNETQANYCSNLTQMECRFGLLFEFFALDSVSNCTAECPEECSTITYSLTIGSLSYPADFYSEALVNRSSYLQSILANVSASNRLKVINDNVMALSVYYDNTYYTIASESPKTQPVDIVANIGGTLGLFIGVSFTTFLEVVDMLYQMIAVVRKKNNVS